MGSEQRPRRHDGMIGHDHTGNFQWSPSVAVAKDNYAKAAFSGDRAHMSVCSLSMMNHTAQYGFSLTLCGADSRHGISTQSRKIVKPDFSLGPQEVRENHN